MKVTTDGTVGVTDELTDNEKRENYLSQVLNSEDLSDECKIWIISHCGKDDSYSPNMISPWSVRSNTLMKTKLLTYTLKLTFSDCSTTIFVDYGKTTDEPAQIDYKKELSEVIDSIIYKRIDEEFLNHYKIEFNDVLSKLFFDNRLFSLTAPKIDAATNTISWEIQEKI